jgi:quinoprotein dehydrogenase-associated probable ABC transporter substrate-binding protein
MAIRAGSASGRRPTTALRVCADPNNLPFSNEKQEGFENRLADLLAADVGARVEYTWWAQRRGFIRSTLDAGLCDVVMGVPRQYAQTLTTQPYYRSAYVFVSRGDRHLRLHSLDDDRLRHLRIGVQLVGDDFANSPPAHALSARGLTRNIVGYSVLGDYAQPNPPARIVDAVARGDIDTALVWGPLAGFFARRSAVPLAIATVTDRNPALPFEFEISMAVRRGEPMRRRMLDDFLARRRPAIDAVLLEFGVPRSDAPMARGGS